jgi:hypothetical protein
VAVITLVFTVLVFFRLGSPVAPESPYVAAKDVQEIILDFGEPTEIVDLYLFLGQHDIYIFYFSAFDEVEEWGREPGRAEGYAVTETPFVWERFDLRYQRPHRYLGVALLGNFSGVTASSITTASGTAINEMVLLGGAGNIIIPLNAADYPGLFDEQEKFPWPDSHDYYWGMMYDEKYHAKTAFELAHGLPATETSHPPLGKSLISLGIRLHGMNPFGWRYMSALFGILMLPLLYVFAKALFGRTLIATAATVLLAADCMHFTLSRIATLDIFVAFFILLMYFLFWKWMEDGKGVYLGLSGVVMGVAVAIKWTGVFAGLGLLVLFLWHIARQRRRLFQGWGQFFRLIGFCLIFFVAVPLLIYILSYIPFVTEPPSGNPVRKALENTAEIFSLHIDRGDVVSNISPTYSWPAMRTPVMFQASFHNDGLISSVFCLGNPAIWWFGIPCILFCCYRWLRRRDGKAGFLVAAYLAQYLPWFFFLEVKFVYHYFPAALFMILMIGYTFEALAGWRPWGRWAVVGFLALAVVVFCLFYPVISGLPTSLEYQLSLRWREGWFPDEWFPEDWFYL